MYGKCKCKRIFYRSLHGKYPILEVSNDLREAMTHSVMIDLHKEVLTQP